MNALKPYAKAVVAAVLPIVLNLVAELGDAAQSYAAASAVSVAGLVAVWATPNADREA